MSNVDWSLAPNWCKGYGLIGVASMPVWFDKHHYQYLHDGRKYEFEDECTFEFSALSDIVERPKQPQAWSGDGLPPVGTICEARILLPGHSNYLWRRCEVVYQNDEMSQSELLVVDIEKTTARWADEFRAIKTEEDIARDQRESAIRDVMDIAQVDCRVTAARLVDAGFKR